MTNRQYLQHRYGLGYWVFLPYIVGVGWMLFFRDYSRPINHVREDLVLLSGVGVIIGLALLQRFIARRTFTCPACRSNLWEVHQHVIGTAAYACPRCGIDMDALKTDRKSPAP